MRLRLAVVATVLLALSGCGTASSERDARASVQRFFAAVGAHDGAGACQELSQEAVSEVEKSEKKPCAQGILSEDVSPAPVDRVRVYMHSAQAKLNDGGAVFLDQTSEGWKISAAGCEPQSGKPYQCELEA
jgi:ketosteroid isomerase-like protein